MFSSEQAIGGRGWPEEELGGGFIYYLGWVAQTQTQKGRAELPTGGGLYVVTKKFTDWKLGKKYRQGEQLRIRNGDMDSYIWAIENGHLAKKKG